MKAISQDWVCTYYNDAGVAFSKIVSLPTKNWDVAEMILAVDYPELELTGRLLEEIPGPEWLVEHPSIKED